MINLDSFGNTDQKRDEINLIFDNAAVVLILVTKEIRIAHINKSGLNMIGKNYSDITGLLGGEVFDCINAWDPENNMVCGRAINCKNCIIRNNITTTFNEKENKYKIIGPFEIIKEGQVIKLQLSVSTSLLKSNGEEYVLLTIDDVTGQKNLEKEIIAQRNLSEKYLQTAGVMICVLNKAGEITLINRKGLEILEYTNENEILGKNWFDISLPENVLIEVKDVFNQIMSGDISTVEYYENNVITKNGNHRIIAFHNTIILDEENKISGVLFSGEDVTIQRQTEEKLKNSELKFRTIADYMSDWGYWENENKRIVYMGPTCKKITGYSVEDFTTNTELINEIIYPDDIELWKAHYNHSHSKEHMNDIEELDFRIYRKDGSICYLAHICKPIFDEKGKFLGRRVSNREITVRKQQEIIINKQNLELQEFILTKDRFISILAHDLRSPFSSILGFIELLSKKIHEYSIDEIKTQLNFINTSANRIFNLLEEMLVWANSKLAKIPYDPQIISFNQICNVVIDVLNPNIIAKGLLIKTNINDDTHVFADANMLKTILRNLISNAIKFCNYGGVIEIIISQDTEYTTISVSDNGIGMSSKKLNKLFDLTEIYSTEGTAKEKGSGIGLLICKEFIEKHNGKIWVKSKVGKGSIFSFTLLNNSTVIPLKN